jgi:hypothetical protein
MAARSPAAGPDRTGRPSIRARRLGVRTKVGELGVHCRVAVDEAAAHAGRVELAQRNAARREVGEPTPHVRVRPKLEEQDDEAVRTRLDSREAGLREWRLVQRAGEDRPEGVDGQRQSLRRGRIRQPDRNGKRRGHGRGEESQQRDSTSSGHASRTDRPTPP